MNAYLFHDIRMGFYNQSLEGITCYDNDDDDVAFC